MKRAGLFLVACLSVSLLCPPMSAPAAAADDPVGIVRSIYAQFGESGERFDVPEAHFTERLLGLWREVEDGGEGDVEDALGFSVFTASRDDETIETGDVRLHLMAEKYVIASYVVMVEQDNAIAATRMYFQYNFEKTAEGWKIDNIDWGPDRQTLRDYLVEVKALQAMR